APVRAATAPPGVTPRPRAPWTRLTTPTTSDRSPPSANGTKPHMPGRTRTQASAGPTTKQITPSSPSLDRTPPPDVVSAIAPPAVAASRPDGRLLGQTRAARQAAGGRRRTGLKIIFANEHLSLEDSMHHRAPGRALALVTAALLVAGAARAQTSGPSFDSV